MDSIKAARRISASLQHHPLNTIAAVFGVNDLIGAHAIVYRNKDMYVADGKGVDCSHKLLDISNIPEDLSGPVVFDCHSVAILCKEFLREIAERDEEIKKLKDDDSFFKKTGLAKLSEREKIALGLKPHPGSDPVLTSCKCYRPNHPALHMTKVQYENLMTGRADIFIQVTEDNKKEIRRVSAKDIQDPTKWEVREPDYSEFMVQVWPVG